jgi:Xaa-Pro dipeptidase
LEKSRLDKKLAWDYGAMQIQMQNYPKHVATLVDRIPLILDQQPFEGIVTHSGQLHYYFADDCSTPFKANPQFNHWVPLTGPGHVVVARAGERPRLIAHVPEDYWYEPVVFDNPFWQHEFDFVRATTEEEVVRELGSVSNLAFIGESTSFAGKAGFQKGAINHELIENRLNWYRSYKTEYEVDCINEAMRLAAIAHRAARNCFEEGGSELDIHYAYVQSMRHLDCDLPYESIVALDEKGAFLHYTKKRDNVTGNVLLLDSGASFHGYASDITRTWTTESADPLFCKMRDDLDELELKLCAMCKPGVDYLNVHEEAHRLIGHLLSDAGVFKIDGDQAFERGLTRPFLPCGVGHFIGIQVHDVSGRQIAPDGGSKMPPDYYPFLRTTRTLEKDHVITIEPGVYFIEMLLREHRSGSSRDAFDWALIERLKSHGGIRIEDDLVVTQNGTDNLTRPVLPE